jgi:hypothetical protein
MVAHAQIETEVAPVSGAVFRKPPKASASGAIGSRDLPGVDLGEWPLRSRADGMLRIRARLGETCGGACGWSTAGQRDPNDELHARGGGRRLSSILLDQLCLVRGEAGLVGGSIDRELTFGTSLDVYDRQIVHWGVHLGGHSFRETRCKSPGSPLTPPPHR